IPDLLSNQENSKHFCLQMREVFSKSCKLVKIQILLARRKFGKEVLKKTATNVEDNFKLNSCFLKWKKFTIDSIAHPKKKFIELSKLRELFRKKKRTMFVTM